MEFLIFLSPSCKAPFVRPSFAARSKEKERGEKKTEQESRYRKHTRVRYQQAHHNPKKKNVLVFILLLSSSIEITR